MIEPDTIRLLRECDAGISIGITSIDDVLDYVQNAAFHRYLAVCREEHDKLQRELQNLLERYHDEGKEPNLMAKGMSWMKTNVKLAMDGSDETIADLMTDGCNMGVKSLSQFLNRYQAADAEAKDIALRLISLEENLAASIRPFL
ncbi:MAG: hypothetical protein ACI4LA_06765 [Emergencia sp.]